MTNEDMLALIRAERPDAVINEVKSFEENQHGFYDVKVDMELVVFGTRIKHVHIRLPYPLESYMKLPPDQSFEWRWKEFNTKKSK